MSDWEPVFSGDALEAELVANLLRSEGFEVLVKSDLPHAYIGSIGYSRVLVEADRLEEAKDLLRSLGEDD
jgi:hypothetical protein